MISMVLTKPKLIPTERESYCDTCNPMLKTMSISPFFETMAHSNSTKTADLLILGKQVCNAGSKKNKLYDGIFDFASNFSLAGYSQP